jgi:hypothetical protein
MQDSRDGETEARQLGAPSCVPNRIFSGCIVCSVFLRLYLFLCLSLLHHLPISLCLSLFTPPFPPPWY